MDSNVNIKEALPKIAALLGVDKTSTVEQVIARLKDLDVVVDDETAVDGVGDERPALSIRSADRQRAHQISVKLEAKRLSARERDFCTRHNLTAVQFVERRRSLLVRPNKSTPSAVTPRHHRLPHQ